MKKDMKKLIRLLRRLEPLMNKRNGGGSHEPNKKI